MSDLLTMCRHEYYSELTNALPPPVSDELEHRERRLTTAIEAFDALCPGNAFEARLAVQIVLCGAHAVECLREAGVYRDDYAKRTLCRAQGNSMMRAETGAKRILAQEQKARLKAEGVVGPVPARFITAAASARSTEPHAPHVQAAAAAPKLAAVPPADAPLRPAVTSAVAAPAPAESAPPPSPEAIAQAEAFMDEAMDAAAQVRHDGGVTPQIRAHFYEVAFPTDPAVIDALVRGSSELLILLDGLGGGQMDAAA
jgi:hypothetical protein